MSKTFTSDHDCTELSFDVCNFCTAFKSADVNYRLQENLLGVFQLFCTVFL